MAILEQMTFDLMGLENNAYADHFSGMDEDAVKDFLLKNKELSLVRTLYQKIKYVKYMCGDMDAAAKHHDLQQDLLEKVAGHNLTGELC